MVGGRRREQRQLQRAGAVALARLALPRHFRNGAQLCLEKDKSGRPWVVDGGHEQVAYASIAHSRSLVAVAVGTVPVGIDVEFIDRPRLTARGPALAAFLQDRLHAAVPVDVASFYRLWTAHEAAIKLGTTLDALRRQSSRRVLLRSFQPLPDYMLTLAVGRESTGG